MSSHSVFVAKKWRHVISITRRCVLVSNTKLLNGRYEIWFYAFWHWTLAAEALGLPCISPYLKSIGPDYKHGANYATLASTVLLPNASLFVTGIQVEEFHHSSDQQGEHIHMSTMSWPNCLNFAFVCRFVVGSDYSIVCWFWLLRLLLLRTDKTSFPGCYWEITLHLIHWPKRFHLQFGSHWCGWSEAISSSSGLTNCLYHQCEPVLDSILYVGQMSFGLDHQWVKSFPLPVE